MSVITFYKVNSIPINLVGHIFSFDFDFISFFELVLFRLIVCRLYFRFVEFKLRSWNKIPILLI